MKSISKTSAILLILFFSFSCKDEETDQLGSAEFSFQLYDGAVRASKTNSTDLPDNLDYILVSIENELGETILHQEKTELTRFDSKYISQPLSLKPGKYQLTEFFIADDTDQIRYAAPSTDAPLAHLVEHTLPLGFTVTLDQVVQVIPEVLSTIDRQPGDFSYTTFGLSVAEIFDFFLTAFTYNETTENFELANATVSICSNSDTLYKGALGANTNRITLPDNREEYKITLSKPDYLAYQQTFSASELKTYYTDPLTIILESNDDILAYFPFNGDALDYSGNKNHCIEHSAEDYVNGVQGSAHNFDGLNDYLQLSQTLNGSQGLSFSFWLNTKGIQPGHINGSIISKYNMYTDYTCFHISSLNSNRANALHASFFASRSTTDIRDCAWSEWASTDDILERLNPQYVSIHSPQFLPQNEWVHCVVNMTHTEIQTWINGQLCTSKTREHQTYLEDPSEPTYIGTCMNGGQGNNNHYYGAIDELIIFDRELSEIEITALYRSN